MNNIYRDHVLDHARRPRNYGVLPSATITHREANPSCGDVIEVYFKVDADGRVESVSFTGHGCVISHASTSMVFETLRGKSRSDILAMEPNDVMGLLGVEPGPMRMNCALLPLRALHKAFRQ